MAYNPITDFIGLWRNSGGDVSKLEMPGLDFVVAALGRAGVIVVTASATPPGANQATTAWLQTATPDWSAEGVFYLWDRETSAYAPATPALFFEFLQASAGVSTVNWWTSTGGAPDNTVGFDGDFALRLDNPYGIYGPKAAGAWPANPIPGSASTVDSAALDNSFGNGPGDILYRDLYEWRALPIHLDAMLLATVGGFPAWVDFLSYFDDRFPAVQGSVLYRGDTEWAVLPPGTENQVLTTHGGDQDPTWTNKSSEFTSGTSMVFRQTAAPLGWTKQTAIDNYGLRVVAGAVSTTAGTGFSTVFSQSTTQATAITIDQMPNHAHATNANSNVAVPLGAQQGGSFSVPFRGDATISGTGSNQGHLHAVNLTLAYTDVIIATKN